MQAVEQAVKAGMGGRGWLAASFELRPTLAHDAVAVDGADRLIEE
ncbi:MAG: hypothetical protein JWM26_4718, partial [Betaproteobacteria bacterium]|nr:hypothetical protein [Betaproteobacteria bacterium]